MAGLLAFILCLASLTWVKSGVISIETWWLDCAVVMAGVCASDK